MAEKTELELLLQQSLDDRRFSRGERQALTALLAEHAPSSALADRLQHRALQLAKNALTQSDGRDILTWFYEVTKSLNSWRHARQQVSLAHTDFSPGNEPRARIIGLIMDAHQSIDCCVFTITDNRITDALLRAHRRGISVRVISDDRKATDRGSDIDSLERHGLPIRLDRTSAHMHHKFAIFDEDTLLTGSYNWTVSAATENHENILVTDDQRIVRPFKETFDALWKDLSD